MYIVLIIGVLLFIVLMYLPSGEPTRKEREVEQERYYDYLRTQGIDVQIVKKEKVK